MTFHDLRATGTTWMAVRGDEPVRILIRLGYRTYRVTDSVAERIRQGQLEAIPYHGWRGASTEQKSW
jgi:hypothetical protein